QDALPRQSRYIHERNSPEELADNTALAAANFFFSSRRRHTSSVSAFLLNRSSDLSLATLGSKNHTTNITKIVTQSIGIIIKRLRSEERFSRNAETDLVCRLLLEKKKKKKKTTKKLHICTTTPNR